MPALAEIEPRYRLVRFDEIDSTNIEAKRRAEAGEPEFTVILAAAQSAGRGRRGRAWASPRGNLYSSVILRPKCTPIVGAQISFVAALAVFDVAKAFVARSASVLCKWPNDVLVNGRKVAGILPESSASGTVLDWLVLGVGINLAHHPGLKGPHPSTSLRDEGTTDLGVEAAAARYLTALAGWYDRWRQEGFEAVRAAWLARSFGLSSPVTVRLEQEPLEGRFAGLDPSGALLLDLASGGRRVIAAGEVFFGEGSKLDAPRD
ncbi:MAG: biotin--[acetyl-CoA-carboxylase] ligase [Alphaproteobacteria bacterium]